MSDVSVTRTRNEMIQLFWPDLPEADVLEALQIIEDACERSVAGHLPSDRLDDITKSPDTRNPLRWVSGQVGQGDIQFELSRALTKRLKHYNIAAAWKRVQTLDEFVRAWCGQQPTRVT